MSQHHQVAAVTRPRGAFDVGEAFGQRALVATSGRHRIESNRRARAELREPLPIRRESRVPRSALQNVRAPAQSWHLVRVPRRLDRGAKDHSCVVGRKRRLRTIALARGELDRCAANLLQPYLRRFAILPGIRDVHDHARVRRQRRPECRRGRPGHVFQTRWAGCF